MKHLLIQSTILALLAFGYPSITQADNPTRPKASPTATPQMNDKMEKKGQKADVEVADKRKQITSEAMDAIQETRNALKFLDENDKDKAIKALERATGKLDLILAREPSLALAPNNATEVTYDLYADLGQVKDARKKAELLLADGKVQDARDILDALRSETVVRVSNIPLATYPDAIKKAVKYIDDGKTDKAKETLQTALDTLVLTDHIIPLPVVAAQDDLSDAKKLSENKTRSADQNKKLGQLLSDARSHLEFAQALGYGTAQDFKDLYGELDTIEGKTSGGKSGMGFFKDIETSLSKLFESIQPKSKAVSKG
jgi:hypothetical protein